MSLSQAQLGSEAGCLTAVSDEGTEVGEFQRLVWGCAASVAETEGEKSKGRPGEQTPGRCQLESWLEHLTRLGDMK